MWKIDKLRRWRSWKRKRLCVSAWVSSYAWFEWKTKQTNENVWRNSAYWKWKVVERMQKKIYLVRSFEDFKCVIQLWIIVRPTQWKFEWISLSWLPNTNAASTHTQTYGTEPKQIACGVIEANVRAKQSERVRRQQTIPMKSPSERFCFDYNCLPACRHVSFALVNTTQRMRCMFETWKMKKTKKKNTNKSETTAKRVVPSRWYWRLRCPCVCVFMCEHSHLSRTIFSSNRHDA